VRVQDVQVCQHAFRQSPCVCVCVCGNRATWACIWFLNVNSYTCHWRRMGEGLRVCVCLHMLELHMLMRGMLYVGVFTYGRLRGRI